MMNKQTFYLVGAFAASLCGSAYAAPNTTSQAQTNQPAQQSPQTQMIQPNSSPMTSDCANLTSDQMTFADQLTDMNLKAVFCSQLTQDQKQQVMAMTYQPDANGNLLTADQAMRNFMQANNMPAPGSAPATTSPRHSGGGCPVN